jgi:hypothetical protein
VITQFGLDGNVAAAPLSAIYSLLLIAGIWSVGQRLMSVCAGDKLRNELWLKLQSPLIGTAVIGAISLSLSIAGVFSRDVASVLAYGLIVLGLIQAIFLFRCCFNFRESYDCLRENKLAKILIITLFVGYFLLSLGPITEADSLDYHVGVALDILNTGRLVPHPEWFHSRLSGSGEALIAVGLSIGAEQFGALLQLYGLIAIGSVFLLLRPGSNERGAWLTLLILSTPVFVAWVSSPKPFLLPMAMTTSALLFCHLYLRSPLEPFDVRLQSRLFFIVGLLCASAASMKMNFMVSGALIVLLGSFYLIRHGNFWGLVKTAPWIFFTVLAPLCFWRSLSFGGGIFDGFYQPLPGDWPGSREFESYLRTHTGSFFDFIQTLFFPSSLGVITTSFGLLAFFIFVLPRVLLSGVRDIGVIALLVLITAILFGQWSARFLLEPFCWIVLAYFLWDPRVGKRLSMGTRVIKAALVAQSVLACCLVYFGVYSVSAGALSPAYRTDIMMKHANGYDVFRWVDQVLPPDAIVISTLRSVSLSGRRVIASDWASYVNEDSPGYQTYLNILSLMKPQFILLKSSKGDLPRPQLCSGEPYAGPFTTRVSTRNPFNMSPAFDAWLYRIDSDCLRKFNG